MMKINHCLDCKIKNIASNFAHSKKNMKYSFEHYNYILNKKNCFPNYG